MVRERDRWKDMTELSTERKRDEAAKIQFLLTGFTQSAGIRIYAFESRVAAGRIDYTVEVDLALIPGFGIRIQDLPLLCRELLQQWVQPDEIRTFVFTEQRMRSHAEKLSMAREDAELRKKQPRRLGGADPETSYPSPFRRPD
jgi:hypothetical protein